jgi:hypothetical protein
MAATYDFTPVNGGANTVGTLESVAQLKAFVIGIDADSDGTDDNPVDLRANDGAHGSMYDLILRELQPLMAHAPNDATGVISVIMDGHGVDAASIAARLEAHDGIGTDTTVAEGTAIVVS